MTSQSSSWEPPLPEELQRLLPQYEISCILGRGGMGAVYRGRQTKLNRTVAIKVLPETFTKGEDELNFAKRFEQEAQAMANLDHPAIISVFDFGETAEGQLYFVMEFIDGMDIHQYLKHHGGKLPQESALAITAHVLDALDYAHNHGIVHRDIKPANILLNHEGRVKIADFGLAKKFGVHADADAPALTISNVAVGTPDFVAPEALDSEQAPDHRADLYAVGVMLYQMLTGKLPRGNYQIPSEMNAEIDPRLDDIVANSMAANPDYRYATAAAMRADLDVIFSQPLARIEPGQKSGKVAAAVPVTSSVKGKKAAKESSKVPIFLGIGAAAAVVVGIVVFATSGSNDSPTGTARGPSVAEAEDIPKADVTALEEKAAPASPPVSSVEKTVESEQPAISLQPSAPAVAEIPSGPSVEEAVAQASLPVASAEKTAELAADAVAPKSELPPTADSPPPTENPLASIPGVKPRLDAYHTARNAQLTELATKYGRGLDSRLNQAADAADLKLATAFADEKARVAALVAILGASPADPIEAAGVFPALETLPEDAPESLAALRRTWTAESAKILADLDGKLGQSLQALEAELTRARDFEKAKAVVAWRESLAEGRAAGPSAAASVATTSSAPTAALGGPSALPMNPAATKDAPFENTLGMKFVPVPRTDVLFCIHEVRYRDYAEYAKEAKESVDGLWKNQTLDGFEIREGGDDHPVTKVNWDDAQAFCRWLSEKEGKTYRLPTDQEWSLAVGIGREEEWDDDTTPETVFKEPDLFPWGKEWPPPQGAGNYSDESRRAKAPRDDAQYLEGYDDGFPTTAPVMSFESNKLGLFDLGGNVFEWVEDWYSGEQKVRVSRGGSWNISPPGILLSSYRARPATPGHRGLNYGFRVVLETTAKTASPPTPPELPIAIRPSAPDPALARATKDAPFANSLGMKFVPVPGTDVLFCIHEVRHRDYAEYAKEAKESVDGLWKNQTHDGFEIKRGGEDHPVSRVNWDDAQRFCKWLSEKEGKTYRLPTDREWSLAVGIGREEEWKSGTTPATVFKVPNAFPWGGVWPPPQGAGNYSDESRRTKAPNPTAKFIDGYDDGFPTTAPVMSFEANPLGLFDLGGNVWEWCEDWYSDEQKDRVLRGASWGYFERDSLLSSLRIGAAPEYRATAYGFRVVLETAADSHPPAAANPPVSPPSTPDPVLARATKDAPFENSLGMEFVPVPGTDVLFCIHETRYRDYEEYVKKAKESVDPGWKIQTQDGLEIKRDADDHPVTRTNWEDAQAFCRWLSEKEGKTYRLPTDREWSLAVGIGDLEEWSADTIPSTVFKVPDAFPWGDEWPPPQGSGNYSDESRRTKAPNPTAKYLDGYDDGFPTTAPVMSFGANQLGLFDLGGNVWEWCEDWFTDEQEGRVMRGGSWNTSERILLISSLRRPVSPVYRDYYGGFRVVLEIAAGSPPPSAANPPVSPPSANRPSTPDPALSRATEDVPFENSLGMKFVPVPGSDVLFCIHETRHRDYEEYARKAKGRIDGAWEIQIHDRFEIKRGGDDHPVVNVSWHDAQGFCRWLSEKEGKIYRLPTDREWSLAVGIGDLEEWDADATPATVFKVPDVYPWGDGWPPPQGAGNYCDESRRERAPRDDAKYLDGYDDGFPTTAPVMSFDANNLGLFDVGGNVWEWCEDWFSVEQKERVLRGGSWAISERDGAMLSSWRYRLRPDARHYHYGFRVVLEIAAGSPPPSAANPPVSPPSTPDPALARAKKDAPFENSLGMKLPSFLRLRGQRCAVSDAA